MQVSSLAAVQLGQKALQHQQDQLAQQNASTPSPQDQPVILSPEGTEK
jgi:hypothetical protein